MTPSPGNVDTRFLVGKVLFDNENGIGAVPLNQEVAYRGAVAWMRPHDFLALASRSEHRQETANQLIELINDGRGVATPFLLIEFPDGDKPFRVVGHEGRARTLAFQKLNSNVLMPVQMHFPHKRARDLSVELLLDLASGIAPEGLRYGPTIVPHIAYFFWNYTKVMVPKELHAVAGDPGVGATQSEQWFSEGVELPETDQYRNLLIDPVHMHVAGCVCASCDVLVDPEEYDLDTQEKMETPVALVNGDLLEELIEPFTNNPPEAGQQTWDSP